MNITQLLRNHTQLPSKYCSVVLETTFLLDTVVIINVCQVMNLPSSFFWSRQEIITSSLSKFIKLWGINITTATYWETGLKSQLQIFYFFFTPYQPTNSLYHQSLSFFGRLHRGLSNSVSQNITLVWHDASRNPAENRRVVSSLIQYLLLCVCVCVCVYKVPDCRKTSQHSDWRLVRVKILTCK